MEEPKPKDIKQKTKELPKPNGEQKEENITFIDKAETRGRKKKVQLEPEIAQFKNMNAKALRLKKILEKLDSTPAIQNNKQDYSDDDNDNDSDDEVEEIELVYKKVPKSSKTPNNSVSAPPHTCAPQQKVEPKPQKTIVQIKNDNPMDFSSRLYESITKKGVKQATTLQPSQSSIFKCRF